MMPLKRVWVWVMAAGIAAAAGCGSSEAVLRPIAGGRPETIRYDRTIFQLAKGQKVQVILFRQTAAPIGYADPDFELVLFELPERASYGWVKEDNIPAYRWVRKDGRDHLWRASDGKVRLHVADDKTWLQLNVEATLEPLSVTADPPYVFDADIRCVEDMAAANGIMNRYGDWLLELLGQKPKAPPPRKTKSPIPSPRKK